MTIARIIESVLITVLSVFFLASCERTITVMSYNVEALFDDVHNGTEYPEYDPGTGKWNKEFFSMRLGLIGDAIKKSVASGPDIVALQEIENPNVLDELDKTLSKSIRGYPYKYMVPVAGSPTNTGILSRYPIKRTGAYYVSPYDSKPLRDILEAQIDVNGNILYFFCNHWKAREGGVAKTEPSRIESASLLKKRISEILASDAQADIVIAGDLNSSCNDYIDSGKKYETALLPLAVEIPEEYTGKSLFVTGDPTQIGLSKAKLIVYDPWLEQRVKDIGSYSFNKKWYGYDHLLLSSGMFDKSGLTYVPGSFTPVRFSFLLDPVSGFPLSFNRVKRTGYSDHLPVIIKLKFADR
jgi:hypothetical protein